MKLHLFALALFASLALGASVTHAEPPAATRAQAAKKVDLQKKAALRQLSALDGRLKAAIADRNDDKKLSTFEEMLIISDQIKATLSKVKGADVRKAQAALSAARVSLKAGIKAAKAGEATKVRRILMEFKPQAAALKAGIRSINVNEARE